MKNTYQPNAQHLIRLANVLQKYPDAQVSLFDNNLPIGINVGSIVNGSSITLTFKPTKHFSADLFYITEGWGYEAQRLRIMLTPPSNVRSAPLSRLMQLVKVRNIHTKKVKMDTSSVHYKKCLWWITEVTVIINFTGGY